MIEKLEKTHLCPSEYGVRSHTGFCSEMPPSAQQMMDKINELVDAYNELRKVIGIEPCTLTGHKNCYMNH